MHDLVEHVKQRSREMDQAILYSVSNSQSISVEEIAKRWGKLLNLIMQRLEILAVFGLVKINGDKVSKGSLALTDITLPPKCQGSGADTKGKACHQGIKQFAYCRCGHNFRLA